MNPLTPTPQFNLNDINWTAILAIWLVLGMLGTVWAMYKDWREYKYTGTPSIILSGLICTLMGPIMFLISMTTPMNR